MIEIAIEVEMEGIAKKNQDNSLKFTATHFNVIIEAGCFITEVLLP